MSWKITESPVWWEIEQLEVSESTVQKGGTAPDRTERTGSACLLFAERMLEEDKLQYEQSRKEMKKQLRRWKN